MENEVFQAKVLEFMSNITEKIGSMDERLSSVERTVTRIENEHGEKLNALFDGYKQHTDQLNRIEEKLSLHDEFILKRIK